MITFNELKVREIMDDERLSRDEKIAELKELEAEARDLERVASESPMNDKDGWEADLREIRLALHQLGAEPSRKGAATL